MSEIFGKIQTAIQTGKAKQAKVLIEQALEQEKIDPAQIIDRSLMPAMEAITESFSTELAFVPDVILASRAMNVATVVLEDFSAPIGEKRLVKPVGLVLTASVKGDLHDIGLNLVSMMFRNVGFEVCNMGCDVAPDVIIKKAEEIHADIICLSAMLTTTMPQIQRLIKLLENKGLREKYFVMIGGAPVTERYAARIGADLYTANAADAAKEAKKYMEQK